MTTNVGRPHENIKHIDIPLASEIAINKTILTAVFYPIESDGSFVFYEDGLRVEVEPTKNRCIVLDNDVLHHGSNPVNHSKRIAINVNFICE
jgi:DNA polymerase elongation subunit (family B)